MLDRFKNSLKIKLLAILAIILAFSFAAISVAIFIVQSGILSSMATQVDNNLKGAAQNAQTQFTALENQVATSFSQMSANTIENLSAKTAAALAKEEDQIKSGMELLVRTNAEILGNLLNKITLTFLVEKNHTELRKYSRLASGSDAVIYVMYLDAQGLPMPGYLDTVDDRIFAYLEKRPTEDESLVVLEESRKDPSVMIYEKKVEYFGELQGTIVVCIAKDAVNRQIQEMAARFDAVRMDNSTEIRQTLDRESGSVLEVIRQNLKTVITNNKTSIDETAVLLDASKTQAARKTASLITIIGVVCCAGTLMLIGIILSRMFIRPVTRISEELRDIAQGEGDLTRRLDINTMDEVGELGKWFNTFISRIHDIIRDLSGSAGQLDQSSTSLTDLAADMADAAKAASRQADNISANAASVSNAVNSVSTAMEESAGSINMVAAAAEEMTATINEISRNTGQARTITDKAVSNVQTASDQVTELGESAGQIEKVVETITDISDQVNLLSLNATIEAARAGEAGKGFAVVANEIKALAGQTADATSEIKERVSRIQTSTGNTIGLIKSISEVVQDVDAIVATIASAVEEQSATTREIAASVGQVSRTMGDVNDNISQSSAAMAEITGEIADLGETAGQISSKSNSVNKNAEDLARMSGEQRRVVGKFKI